MASNNPIERPTPDELAAWPNCQWPDCANKSCARLNSLYCHPCSERLEWVGVQAPPGYFHQLREAQHRANLSEVDKG